MVNVDRGQRQRYTIGLTAYRIGINYTNNLDFISVIEPELRAFAKEVGKPVFFGVRSDHDVVYICKAESDHHDGDCRNEESDVLHLAGKGDPRVQ